MCPGDDVYHRHNNHPPHPHEQLLVIGTQRRVQHIVIVMGGACHCFHKGEECVLALQHDTQI